MDSTIQLLSNPVLRYIYRNTNFIRNHQFLSSIQCLFGCHFGVAPGLFQIEHLSSGFIALPLGQLNTFANSKVLETLPITRIFPGLWTSKASFLSFSNSGVVTSHQV